MSLEIISVAEAAAKLKLHRTRINQLINSGALPAIRIGKVYGVRVADLALVSERPKPGPKPKAKSVKPVKKKTKTHKQ